MCELAEKLHMTVGEICFGRGTPMSLHELYVGWPAFERYKQDVRDRAEGIVRVD